MIVFFRTASQSIYAVGASRALSKSENDKLTWLFGGAKLLADTSLNGVFTGPRKEMVTPWSTNAVEITQNMGIQVISRIEEFIKAGESKPKFDPMLQALYTVLDQDLFTVHHTPDAVTPIQDIEAYNRQEGLALSKDEITYLQNVSKELGRPLTDSEVFGFSQVNSEHCRHKIFNGTFVIDGQEKPFTLFRLIRKTSEEHPNYLISAYKDNVAFIQGPVVEQFAPARQDIPDYFTMEDFESVISLKAETHNFPTTVEPFNGAATGGGGEIRDRLAGGKGSLPLAGTAVYMTSYPRLEGSRTWEGAIRPRKWLYHPPAEILIKASDGASDFGNKFGQPLICGSVLTFEHEEKGVTYGYDKVIMLAGGVGYGKKKDSQKGHLKAGDKIVLLGGDNYRIGMGGGAVSSVATGEYGNAIELNAVQRSNPEMQKRVMNAIRAMVEAADNAIISIHDHGAGGHLNCLSELLEETGGIIEIGKLPVGDPTLSAREIISNESQERMGLALHEEQVDTLKRVADRERAPMYVIGTATGDKRLQFSVSKNSNPFDLRVEHLFGSSPKTVLTDKSAPVRYAEVSYDENRADEYLNQVLQLESVACKDWLTNKVDRSVTGRVATQQTCGSLQLPLNNVGVMALDFLSHKGIATSIGHAPGAALVNPAAGSELAIAEALLNIVWAPLTHGLKGVSLSANWMWPAKTAGENARLYAAVESVSAFARALGINIPTGKDSLSMTQKYPDGSTVISPGTVIISAAAEVEDVRKTISPDLKDISGTKLIHIDFSKHDLQLGGSALAQVLNELGEEVPRIADASHFIKAFETVQGLIRKNLVVAGHDVSAGGLITTLLEMCFPNKEMGMRVDLTALGNDWVKVLFNENPSLVLQVQHEALLELTTHNIPFHILGEPVRGTWLEIDYRGKAHTFDIPVLRQTWFRTSFLMDQLQRPGHADKRRANIFQQQLTYRYQARFDGRLSTYGINAPRRTPSGIRAAIIREKGVNGDREMAYALYLAGFDVKDVHMTDLVSGRENLEEVNMIVFVGGFSNSDVLGSAKGWAGAFLYNEKARKALDNFYAREDTLSLGVCNGCQLMMELGLVYRDLKMEDHPKMHHNGSGKFESAFISIEIPENNSVMLHSYAGSRLGVWLAHGEGKFVVDSGTRIQVAASYGYKEYPGNPNDSQDGIAAVCSHDGRHLAIMPHIERSLFPWNWPHYTRNKQLDEVGPWVEAFVNARDWVKARIKG